MPRTPGDRWEEVEPLAGDASQRRYARLRGSGASAIAATYPETVRGQLARDAAVLGFLAAAGLRVPRVLEVDLAAGRLVVEDLGREDAAAALAAAPPGRRLELALPMVEPLAGLARLQAAVLPPFNPPLDEARLRYELAGFELWYLRHRRGLSPDAELDRWLDHLAARVAGHPRRVCHRDYHLNNLFLLPGGEVGMIDVQDLLVGPDTYDAASLVGERAFPELLEPPARAAWLEHWAERTGASPGWRERWQEVRLQRALKVLGTFARLAAAGNPAYEDWLARLEDTLRRDLAVLPLPRSIARLLLDLWTDGG